VGFGSNNDFVFVAVPPEHVAEVQRRLADLGIGSSLHGIEEGETRIIHAHTTMSPDRLHTLLAGKGWPSRLGGDRGQQPGEGQS
jgi:hypothetical protein